MPDAVVVVELRGEPLHPLAARLRQAALGCTIHPHGPVNALAAIIEADRAGDVDAVEIIDQVLTRCTGRLGHVDQADAARELRLVEVLTVFRRGLSCDE